MSALDLWVLGFAQGGRRSGRGLSLPSIEPPWLFVLAWDEWCEQFFEDAALSTADGETRARA